MERISAWGVNALVAKRRLEVEDLSQTCRSDRFCIMCVQAFCSHCCKNHHTCYGFHNVIEVDLVGGKPSFPRVYAPTGERMCDFVAGIVASADYATRLPRDAFCVHCGVAFSSATCCHHHRLCGADSVARVEARAGRHCLRCTGSEWWFPYVEPVLGDPVGEDEDELLLPVLSRLPGTCAQCGAPVPHPDSIPTPNSGLAFWLACKLGPANGGSHCSEPCAAEHRRDVAARRERREAILTWRAARELAKLQINESVSSTIQ